MKKNLVKKFKENGYVYINVLNSNHIEILKKQILIKLNKSLSKIKLKKLENFHNEKINSSIHSKLLNPSKRYITLDNKIFLSKKFKNKISKFLKEYWGHSEYKILWVGSLKKNEIKKNKIGFRIVRPHKNDESGVVHTDSYSKFLDSFITLWIPLIGFNNLYTLRYAKKSHHLNHQKNKIKQTKYNSKALKKSYIKKFKFVRPNLKIGHGIIHHPNILHGESKNLGKRTRVSIELRIFNLKKYNISNIFNKNFYY